MRFAAYAVAAVAGVVFGLTVPAHASGPTVTQAHRTKGCAVVQTHVKGWAGMPYQYSLIFCGKGIQDQVLTCPTAVTEQPMYPAEVFDCTVKYYPRGFPSWMSPPVPRGY